MTMSKKSLKNNRRPQRKQIDNIANYSQQPRSKKSPPKHRADFSVFQRYPSYNLYNSGSLSESSHGEVGLSLSPWTDLKEMQSKETEYLESALVSCSNLQNNGPDFAYSHEVPVTGFETVVQNVTSHHSSKRFLCAPMLAKNIETKNCRPSSDHISFTVPSRKTDTEHCDAVKMLDSSPVWSQGIRDIDMTLSELARAKATVQMRCPAQELEKKGHPTSRREPNLQQDNTLDKWTSCTSSEADNFVERGRGKRERKCKVYFDDITTPVKSERKVRRFKIMRCLGLAAPIGSPF